MTPLEAARGFAAMTEADLRETTDYRQDCGFCGGFTIGEGDERRYEHYPSCLWLNRQKIVAALEAAKWVASLWHDLEIETGTVESDAFAALVAALKDTP